MLRRLLARHFIRFQVLVTLPFVFMVSCSLVEMLVSRAVSQGYFEPILAPELAPTAQSLLRQPLPVPAGITIDPPPGSTIENRPFCIGYASPEDIFPFERWERTRILVNGTRLARTDIALEFSGPLCVVMPLPPGLHLIELQIRHHPLGAYDIGEPLHYRWAYQVKRPIMNSRIEG